MNQSHCQRMRWNLKISGLSRNPSLWMSSKISMPRKKRKTRRESRKPDLLKRDLRKKRLG